MTTGFRESADWAEWFMHLQDPPCAPALLSVQVEPTGLVVICEGAATSHRDTARLLGNPKQIAMTRDMVEFLIDVLPKALAKKDAVSAADPDPDAEANETIQELLKP